MIMPLTLIFMQFQIMNRFMKEQKERDCVHPAYGIKVYFIDR